jgi:hypothetical protein
VLVLPYRLLIDAVQSFDSAILACEPAPAGKDIERTTDDNGTPSASRWEKKRSLCGTACRQKSGFQLQFPSVLQQAPRRVADVIGEFILERFPAKWIPVRVKKTRQIKNLEPRSDSIGTEKALAGPSGYHFVTTPVTSPRRTQASTWDQGAMALL